MDVSTAPGAAAASADDPSGTRLDLSLARVLVVDDVPENRDLLVRRLARFGIADVVEAENGSEALRELEAAHFDLVLLDMMMPVMNGHQVLEHLNADGRIHSLAVIVISALSEVEDIARCIERGAEDFLLKPFNHTLLRARVFSSLEKKQLRDRTRAELQRKQAELAEARTLQLALAPDAGTRDAAIGSIAIDLVLDPAKEVGGDLVDHFPVGDGLHVFVLGDVCDKGAGAALMMARTYALFRGFSARPDADRLFADPAVAMHEANMALAANNPSSMFVTLWLGCLGLDDGVLRHVRAGHVPPFVRRANGAIERIGGVGGLPLGVSEGARYTASDVTLEQGDALLAITDGISEALAPDGAMFEEAGAEAWFATAGPEATVAGLVDEVRKHEAGLAASDDVAAILVRLAAAS